MNFKKVGHIFCVTLVALPFCSAAAQKNIPPSSYITYIGVVEYSDNLNCFGVDAALDDAIESIVPKEWSVKISPNVKMSSKTISWSAGKSWVSVLDYVLRSYQLRAIVDFSKKNVEILPLSESKESGSNGKSGLASKGTLKPSPPPSSVPVPTPTIKEISVRSETLKPENSIKSLSVSKNPILAPTPVPKPIPKPMPIWIASPTFTLQENITAWAHKEGWKVVWNTKIDYPIEVEFRIQDKFLNVIKKTIELYQHAERPLYAEAIPAQRLIVVTSK